MEITSRYADHVEIDPARVPEEFRHLLPLAKEWSIGDDVELDAYIEAAPLEKKRDAHINSLVTAIQPAVEATRGADLEATVKANVENVVHSLRSSEPVLKKQVEAGTITVVGAYYNLDTGAVAFSKEP